MGKGENAGYQNFFPPFPSMFTKAFYVRFAKTQDCVVKCKIVIKYYKYGLVFTFICRTLCSLEQIQTYLLRLREKMWKKNKLHMTKII